jgi:hypothetical protein
MRFSTNPFFVGVFLSLGLASADDVPKEQTLTVKGFSGQAPVVQVNGKSYVEIEAFARLTNGTLAFHGSQIVFTLPGGAVSAAPAPVEQVAKLNLSRDFLRAAIEELTVIREWRSAIVNAVQNNYPVSDDWVAGYRNNAQTKLELASAAATRSADKDGYSLLSGEFNNMKGLSDKYLGMHNSLTYIPTDSLNDDSLDKQVLNCAEGLATLAASGQFQDVTTCH